MASRNGLVVAKALAGGVRSSINLEETEATIWSKIRLEVVSLSMNVTTQTTWETSEEILGFRAMVKRILTSFWLL